MQRVTCWRTKMPLLQKLFLNKTIVPQITHAMKDKLVKFIEEKTFSKPGTIKDDTALFEEGIFDSMGLLGLINFLEDEFKVVTSDVELTDENFRSVNTIMDFISRKRPVAV